MSVPDDTTDANIMKARDLVDKIRSAIKAAEDLEDSTKKWCWEHDALMGECNLEDFIYEPQQWEIETALDLYDFCMEQREK